MEIESDNLQHVSYCFSIREVILLSLLSVCTHKDIHLIEDCDKSTENVLLCS
jgi:hypothetical protein